MDVEQRLYLTLSLLFFVLVMGSVGYFIIFQGEASLVDCFYMTVVTLSTVGYGEILDVSGNITAKIFTMFLMVAGIGIVAYGISLTTAFLVEGELKDLLRRRAMDKKIAKMNNHFVICGGGETGMYILEEFTKVGAPSVVIDNSPERIEAYKEMENILWVEGDCTEDDVLIEAGIKRARGVVVALPSDKDNLFTTVTAQQLNPKAEIVAKATTRKMQDKLKRAGARSVVCPNSIGGLRIASEMIRPTVVSFLDVMLRDHQRTMRIEEVHIGENSKLLGKPLREIGFKEKLDLLVLAVIRPDSKISYNPTSDTEMVPGLTLIVMGDQFQVQKAKKIGGGDHEF